MRFLLSTFGTGGDVYPFVALGNTLRLRGHEVTFVANEPYGELARANGLRFEALVSGPEFHDLIRRREFWHPVKGPALASAWWASRLESQYELFLGLARDAHVMVSSVALTATRMVQESTGKPLASVVLQPFLVPSMIDPPVMPAGPRVTGRHPWLLRRMHRGFVDVWGSRMVTPNLNRLRRRIGLPRIRDFFRWWFSPDLAIGLFPPWYGPPPADWPPQLRLAGFPLGDVEMRDRVIPSVEDAVASADPPVAFTAGTGMMHAHAFYREGALACARIGRRAVLVTAHREQLPAQLPEGARHFDYVPFDRLFPRCSAVVHHGGVGTTAQGLAAGAPQLIMPIAWDQRDNAERVRRLGVGDELPPRRFRAPAVAATLTRLLGDTALQRRCREVAARFGGDPLAGPADWLEELARKVSRTERC